MKGFEHGFHFYLRDQELMEKVAEAFAESASKRIKQLEKELDEL